MAAFSAGRGKDRCIGDRRAVVAVNGPGQRCADRRQKNGHSGRSRGADRDDDRQQNSKCTPGCSHGKGEERRQCKDDCREKAEYQISGRACHLGDQISHKRSGTDHVAANPAERPGKRQDHNGRDHRLYTLDDTVHETAERNRFARNVEQRGDQQRTECTNGKTDNRVFSDRLGKSDSAAEKAADVCHAENGENDQYENRDHKIENAAVFGGLDPVKVHLIVVGVFF